MNLQPLKIPRGYRGDWPVQEYALIDAVESVITEVELARGSNASLAEELEETYATKSYVQLAISNPNVNDIYVSDLSVKVSEQGLIGYSLQVNGAGSLVFANTYELGNGTLTTPSLYFSDNVDAGIFVNYSTSVEDFNIKVASGIIAKFSHNKISGENTLIFGNLQLSSGGDISGIHDLTGFRRLVTTGTGAYRSEFAEIYVSTITLNTLQANNFGKILDLGVVDANTLVSDTIYGKCAAGSTNLPEANAGYISHLVRGAGDLMQKYLSESTGYLYRRVKIGGTFGTWTKFAKSVGDSSITFSVADGVVSNDAVNKGQLDSTLTSANSYTDTEILTLSTATQNALDLKADLNGNTSQKFSIQDGVANTDAASVGQVNSAQSSAIASANGYTDSAVTGLESSISGEIVSIGNRLDSAESDIVSLSNPILKVIGYLYAKLTPGSNNLLLGYNSIISAVSRHAGSGGYILNVTFSAPLDSPFYFVIGGVSGGGGSGGRSFEVKDQTVNGFKVQSEWSGDNTNGWSDSDGAVYQMLIYQ